MEILTTRSLVTLKGSLIDRILSSHKGKDMMFNIQSIGIFLSERHTLCICRVHLLFDLCMLARPCSLCALRKGQVSRKEGLSEQYFQAGSSIKATSVVLDQKLPLR